MTSEYLTRKELIRRRKLNIQELLNAYQVEYVELLKEMGNRYHKLKSPLVNDLSEVQKLLVVTKYKDLLKGTFQTQQRTPSEITELNEAEVPILTDVKITTSAESAILSFPQAERFLISQTENALRSSSRLTPHLSTSSSNQLTESEHTSTETKTVVTPQSPLIEKMTELHRLEELASAASGREMDRRDCLMMLFSDRGRYLIRQCSFTIGRSRLNSSNPSPVDVNLSKEDSVQNENQILAHVWMKTEGKFFLRCAGMNEIIVDGVKVKQGEVAPLRQWSLLEIDRVQLMTLINFSAVMRVRKRSRQVMNI
eukprot:g6682.t1